MPTTRGHISKSTCSKSVFDWDSAMGPAEGTYNFTFQNAYVSEVSHDHPTRRALDSSDQRQSNVKSSDGRGYYCKYIAQELIRR